MAIELFLLSSTPYDSLRSFVRSFFLSKVSTQNDNNYEQVYPPLLTEMKIKNDKKKKPCTIIYVTNFEIDSLHCLTIAHCNCTIN